MTFNGVLKTIVSALRWEGEPTRPYVHPSQYRAPENVRLYSDGMHKLYEPSLITLAIATLTLGLYIGIPHILLGLLAFSWYKPAFYTLLALFGTLLLPAKPLRVNSVLSSYVFLCWRRYFKFSYLFEQSLDCYQDYIIAQFPHGAFPLGAVLGGTFMATEYPEYYCYALAATSAFYVPIWRHVHAWLGTETCTKVNFHHLLSLGVTGPLQKRRSVSGSTTQQLPSVAEDQPADTAVQADAAVAAAAPAAKLHGSPFACATVEADLAGEGMLAQSRSQLCRRRSLDLALPRRLSITASIRNNFRLHHSVSDTDSSDSDSESCSCSPRHRGVSRRVSASSDTSNSSNCSSCSPLVQIQTHNSMPARVDYTSSKLGSTGAKPIQVQHADTLPSPPQQQQQQQHSSNTSRVDPSTGKRKTGVSVGLMVGGIAEMFMIRKDHERIKLRDRKGFVRIALEHGVAILPVYMFGANQVLDFGPPWLQRFSRKMRASLGMIYGLWGLPVPRRVPIFMVTGKPLDVGPAMRKDHPDFQRRVDELHAQFIAEMERIYYTHRGKYGHGYENRPLVVC